MQSLWLLSFCAPAWQEWFFTKSTADEEDDIIKKHYRLILICGAFLLIIAAGAFTVLKLNKKINNLFHMVVQLQDENTRAKESPQLSVIPDLYPHGAGWKITQYGDVFQSQEICYTITTDQGLVIIDGGEAYEEERLRRIIASYGNRVEAWILTHPHEDHMTAFLDIYQDPRGMEIHHVYTTELPEMDVMMANAAWDDYSLLETFRSLDIPELTYLHTGDTLNILGLDVLVLHAYDEKTDGLSNDLMNDGSLVFRIDGKQDSMIFCADAGSAAGNPELSILILEDFKEHLKCDYIQMGHHGFGGLSQEFYRAAAPKAAFFDSPAWLLSGEDVRSCKENEEFMESMGCTIFSFYTTPNQILLR